MDKFKSVCVYCGSSKGYGSTYSDVAVELAEYFITEGYRLVNGGGSIGLMGVMTNRILELGGEAVGVIPTYLKELEVAHLGMTELIVVPDMHTRKLTMVNLADAFICLPGGFGTMDEVFETLTWSQLHLHRKPIGMLNVDGFYDPLVQMIEQMSKEKFLRAEARALLHIADDIPELFGKLYSPNTYSAQKWDTEPLD
jgi:uncharacterized protein (TIGR00730 family)